MLTAPLPPDEAERLRALTRLAVLDSAPEREFDALVATAALICGVPVSLISLVDSDRQWFKANVGLPGVTETPRDAAFCAHAILGDGVFEVPDATADARFADNPLVTQAPDIRFYAGAPLRLSDGAMVGTLCVIDRVPRTLNAQQREALRLLSLAAAQALESRRMARAFVASESRFRTLSESAPLGVFATDAAGACTYTNGPWQAIFGLNADEALGQGWARALHPDDREAVFGARQRAVSGGEGFELSFRVRHRDGAVRHVRVITRPVRDDEGRVTDHVGSVEDVTERLRDRQAIEGERARLAALLEGTGAGTWEWNVQTGETRINARWAEIVGRRLDELTPTTIQTWVDLAHPDDLVRSGELLRAHFAGETAAYECEARMRHRDGHWVWVLDRGRVLTRTPEGQPEWMFGTHLDISGRKAQEARLRKSEALLSSAGALAEVGGWEMDLIGGELTWTDQTCRIHGVEPGHRPQLTEAIGFYPPEARPVVELGLHRALADGRDWDLELPLIQRDGRRIWVRAVGHVEQEDGRPVRLLGALQDITAQVEQRQMLLAAQQRIELAADSGGIGVWERDLQTGAERWDARTYALYGLTPDVADEPAVLWARHLHPDDHTATQDAIERAAERDEPLSVDYRVVWPDGSVHHLHSAARLVRDRDGRPAQMIGVDWDTTSLRALNAQLAEQHELLRVTLNAIGDAVITTDAQGRVSWLNPVAERMTGWPADQAQGRPLAEVCRTVDEETRAPVPSPVEACLAQREPAGPTLRTVLVARGGAEHGIEDSAAPIRGPQGEVLGAVLVFHDVTEQRRLSGEMNHRATHDALTGLVNRAEFEARLRRALDRVREDRGEHVLLFIDLDQFKLVNDACGHPAGDLLLQQIARMLREAVRTRDTLARIGGDEFAVILEHCAADQALRVAEQVCERMDGYRFVHGERRFRIGASIGLVPIDARWSTLSAVMQAADTACYAAKEAGRNRVHAWSDTDQTVRARQGEMQWAARLEQALDEGLFELHAQHIVPLAPEATGLHAEVLIRLRERDGQLVPPGAFLPAAERFHMAARIDRWVLGRALSWIQALPDLAALDTLCINLSGQSVGDRAFHRYAAERLAEAGPAVCARICLEITETVAVTHLVDAAHFIEQVRAMGVRIALDDFGAGASSFGYLKTLKVDVLKIDGSFIRDLPDDPLDDATVRCFVDVARLIGVETVAEFVDRPEVLARVREIDITYAQGFLLHRPVPIDDLRDLCGRRVAPVPA